MSDITAEPNHDFPHGHFEYCYNFLAQKYTILEYTGNPPLTWFFGPEKNRAK